MFGYLIVLFTVLPALELVVLIDVGGRIGSLNTILLIIFTGVTGAALARYQGFLVLQKIQANVNKGLLPNDELMDGLMILIGGITLLTPGFITDTIGLLLLIPLTRQGVKIFIRKYFESMIKTGTHNSFTIHKGNEASSKQYDDIDI